MSEKALENHRKWLLVDILVNSRRVVQMQKENEAIAAEHDQATDALMSLRAAAEVPA